MKRNTRLSRCQATTRSNVLDRGVKDAANGAQFDAKATATGTRGARHI